MSLSPPLIRQYHIFLASPGDVDAERKYVRKFFEDYNRHTAHLWNARFEVVDWENYATIGVGRPQELITRGSCKTTLLTEQRMAGKLHTSVGERRHRHDHYPVAMAATSAVEPHRAQDGPITVSD